MPLVRSISNHPYRGYQRNAGAMYEAHEADVATLIALKRAVLVKEEEAAQTYKTRELQAEPPTGVITTRGVITPEQMAQRRVPRSRRTGGA